MNVKTILGIVGVIGGGLLTALSAVTMKKEFDEESEQIHEKGEIAREALKIICTENEMSVEQIAGAFGVEEALRVAKLRGETYNPQDEE